MAINFRLMHSVLLMLIAFTFPMERKIVAVMIVLFVLNWFVSGRFLKLLREMRFPVLTWLFSGVYVVYAAGMIYSENPEYGLQDLETKLSLLFFPLIFSSSWPLKRIEFYKVLYSYIAGCTLAVVMCFGIALYKFYILDMPYYHFYYARLSYFLHPGYFSMYLNLAVVILTYMLLNRKYGNRIKVLFMFLMVLYFVTIILLQAKIGIITILTISLAFVIYLMARRKFLKQGLGILAAILFLAVGVVTLSENYSTRIDGIKSTLLKVDSIDRSSTESTAVRLLVWEAAFEVIKDYPFFGAGTGDVKDELLVVYKDHELTGALKKKLNTHNQFLQTYIAVGLPGILLLIVALVFGIKKAMEKNMNLYIAFMFIIYCNMLVESILENQAGVTFFAFFNAFFIYTYQRKPKL